MYIDHSLAAYMENDTNTYPPHTLHSRDSYSRMLLSHVREEWHEVQEGTREIDCQSVAEGRVTPHPNKPGRLPHAIGKVDLHH